MLPADRPVVPALDCTNDASDAEVESLPGADDDFGFGGSHPEAVPIGPGTRLGDVTIVRLIAEGGMGAVYEGRQESPARTVAVKVLRRGHVAPSAVRRFQHEAQFLARLGTPGIAHIYSAGIEITSAGENPYFIMEFVADAAPLTDFARARGLSMRDRVTLFARVAAAVAHAHREGIAHRDLKPGNILVDATGHPKIIDFGVARAIGSTDERLTTDAEMGQLLGTVRYMAPEQLGLADTEADARSDVYSLGLVLHELLFDELPYDLGNKTILEAASILSDRTGGDAPSFARSLRGHGLATVEVTSLAIILATCLEPRPADRYQSGRDLFGDIDRWLAGAPIHARPPTLADSIRRFTRRHRTVAASMVGIVAALVVMVAGLSWAWQEAEEQRKVAANERAAADGARHAAEARRGEAEFQATEARRQLYFSTVLLAAEARDRDNLREARRLLAEARALAPEFAAHPIELDYLAASLDDAVATLDAGAGTVTALAVSRDGGTLVVATEQGRVLRWSPGEPPAVLGRYDERVWAIALSPQGDRVAVGTSDGRVIVCAASTAREIACIEAHQATIYGLDFSPSGDLLASSSRDRSVRLWDTRSWGSERILTGHDSTVLSAAFSPDGGRMLTTSSDGTARVWQIDDGREVLRVGDGSGRLFRGAWAGDGRRFATGGEDGKALIWDATSGTLQATLRHSHRINALAFDGDRGHLLTASGDAILRSWEIATGDVVAQRRGHANGIWSLALAPSHVPSAGQESRAGRTVATGSADGTVRIWDLSAASGPMAVLGGRGVALASSPANDVLAVGSASGDVRLLDPRTLQERRRFTGLVDRVNGLAFAPDGELLAATDDNGALHRWHLPDGTPLGPIRVHTRRGLDVSFAPDGRTVATAGEDRTVRLLDPENAEDRTPPLKHPARVFSAAFRPDGRLLATACEDRHVRLWDPHTGVELAAWPGHDRAVNWVCFSPDATRLASASSDGTVRIWNIHGSIAQHVSGVRSPPARVLTGPTGQVWKVAFSPDGARIAATSADGMVQLWDTATGQPVSALRGHRDATWGLAFLDDGHVLATTSWDGTLRLWGVPTATLAAARAVSE